jgi:hypothetical protein
MSRKHLTETQKAELREANRSVCCVCKERGLGINFHHIDHDSSNSDSSNIAVLCVKDHDAHHRPHRYEVNHTELSREEIRRHKQEWEAFVEEAQKQNPNVLAVINVYGSRDEIHALRLIFQDKNSNVVLERVYHFISGPPDRWVDAVVDEVKWLGENIKIAIVGQPLDVEYCPCCEGSLASTIDPNAALKITSPDWDDKSLLSLYINPERASLALLVSYADQEIVRGFLHKCGHNHLHFQTDDFQERVPIQDESSVRDQAKDIVHTLIETWKPGRTIIGTGDHTNPKITGELKLPEVWESEAT